VVPFIDAGIDWIETPSHSVHVVKESPFSPKSDDDMEWNDEYVAGHSLLLKNYLESTPWWVTRRSRNVAWDGHSAFVDRGTPLSGEENITVRKSSRIRSLRKKDLYQAWNAMMHTPRFVRRKLRRSISRAPISEVDSRVTSISSGEDSTGETIVWRRFMDQISDISYRADSKRLGDDHLHDLFGEFRHYIVERYAYSTRNGVGGGESADVRIVFDVFEQFVFAYSQYVLLVAILSFCGAFVGAEEARNVARKAYVEIIIVDSSLHIQLL
jgi:hypothetical protein